MKYDVVVKQETENKYYQTLAVPESTIWEPFAEKFLSVAKYARLICAISVGQLGSSPMIANTSRRTELQKGKK